MLINKPLDEGRGLIPNVGASRGASAFVHSPTPGAYSNASALKHFDALPNSAHVRVPVVMALFACSPATVWRGVRNGRLPKPVKLFERASAWNVGALRLALKGQGNQGPPTTD